MKKNKKNKQKKNQNSLVYKCESCEQIMTKKDGYEGTGLCGVCACGSAKLLEEFGETW